MKILPYCPSCGKETLQWDNNVKFNCRECSFTLYHNTAGAVAVILRYGDEIYFTRRNQEPKKGKLDLSGGFIDPKESAEFSCKRELLEELNYEIDETKLRYIKSLPNIYHYKEIDYNTIDLFFEYHVPEKFETTLAESEISEGIWIPIKEINLDDIAFESQKKFFKDYI